MNESMLSSHEAVVINFINFAAVCQSPALLFFHVHFIYNKCTLIVVLK